MTAGMKVRQQFFWQNDAHRKPLRKGLLFVDAFAGGGGASQGVRQAIGRDVDIAINHDRNAIGMHMQNHPAAETASPRPSLKPWSVPTVPGCVGSSVRGSLFFVLCLRCPVGEVTGVSWAHHSLNLWIGCQRVSEGCLNCYAERMQRIWKQATWGPETAGGTRIRTKHEHWGKMLKWNEKAKAARERRRVFINSQSDFFEDWTGPMANFVRAVPAGGRSVLLQTGQRPQRRPAGPDT